MGYICSNVGPARGIPVTSRGSGISFELRPGERSAPRGRRCCLAGRGRGHRNRDWPGRRGPGARVRAVLPRARAAAPLQRLGYRIDHCPQHRPRSRRRHCILSRAGARRHVRPHPPAPPRRPRPRTVVSLNTDNGGSPTRALGRTPGPGAPAVGDAARGSRYVSRSRTAAVAWHGFAVPQASAVPPGQASGRYRAAHRRRRATSPSWAR